MLEERMLEERKTVGTCKHQRKDCCFFASNQICYLKRIWNCLSDRKRNYSTTNVCSPSLYLIWLAA